MPWRVVLAAADDDLATLGRAAWEEVRGESFRRSRCAPNAAINHIPHASTKIDISIGQYLSISCARRATPRE